MSFAFYEEDDEDDTLPVIPPELLIPQSEIDIFEEVAMEEGLPEEEEEEEMPEKIEVVKIQKKHHTTEEKMKHSKKMEMRYKMIQDIKSYTLADFMKNEKARKILEKTWANKYYRNCGNYLEEIFLDYYQDAKDRDLNVFELIPDDYVFSHFNVLFMDLVKFHVKRRYKADIFYYKPRLALSFIHKLEKEKYYRTQKEMAEREQKMKETSKHFNWGTKSYEE
jgi:hypothetical protein